MPLASLLPGLDDRSFDDIVAEAQTRIPRYTKEWTDFNPGDAGFALVELFAWMTELLIFRLNQVPMLNYIKFLQLIGIELKPAQPAEVVIVFPVQASFHPELRFDPGAKPSVRRCHRRRRADRLRNRSRDDRGAGSDGRGARL